MYQVSDHTRSQFEKMLGLASVKEALAFIEANQPEAIEEQKELVLIEAPTGHEENRAKVFAEKFKALGLEDVHTDRGGNVIGIRRGTGKGPIEGHMDTVFPFGTVKGVEEKDGFLYAPGIGDDTRALAMLLCLIRTLNKTGIQTAGDIVFVGTTREEGMGGLGGMKDFLADNDRHFPQPGQQRHEPSGVRGHRRRDVRGKLLRNRRPCLWLLRKDGPAGPCSCKSSGKDR